MRAIVNGKSREATEEEVSYLKQVFGVWEEVYIFNSPDFYTVSQMSELLKLKENTIYVRNRRNPGKYPLGEFSGKKGCYLDTILKFWIKK